MLLKVKRTLCTAAVLLSAVFISAAQPYQANNIQLADPTMFYNNGTYYLYGTSSRPYLNGFVVYTSPDLNSWQGPNGASGGYALAKGAAYGTEKFWAPQVFSYKGKYYMAYAANSHVALAVADSPLGPFTQQNKVSLFSEQSVIDPFIFIDGDKKYLYHVVVANGGNRIYVAQLNDDLSAVIPQTTKLCITATEPWENTENAKWLVTEGPTVVKHNGWYYLLYSANHFRSKDYSVGYAVSKSPMGPWQKVKQNPLISRHSLNKNGTGHGDLFQDKDGKWKYVMHTHNADSVIGPRLTAIVDVAFVNGKNGPDIMQIQPQTLQFLQRSTH